MKLFPEVNLPEGFTDEFGPWRNYGLNGAGKGWRHLILKDGEIVFLQQPLLLA